MGFFDTLFGNARLPKARPERLFSMATAYLAMETSLGWAPAGRAGICLKPVTAGDFVHTAEELAGLIRLAVKETSTQLQITEDEYRFRWFIFQDPDFEDLVTLGHMVAQTLEDHGYGEQLLSAVFRFLRREAGDQPAYFVYNYKRGAFYPFVPVGQQQRDNASELRASAILDKELPLEKDLERWYALWNCPV
ncbi:MAG: hypothetical protein M1379_08305 [Firmicutes bacterium]|nr:hypothetical protein [Bacillota bacterium]